MIARYLEKLTYSRGLIVFGLIYNEIEFTEELIDDIKNGKMIIVMDDEDRENEGDFIVAAEFCNAEHELYGQTRKRIDMFNLQPKRDASN